MFFSQKPILLSVLFYSITWISEVFQHGALEGVCVMTRAPARVRGEKGESWVEAGARKGPCDSSGWLEEAKGTPGAPGCPSYSFEPVSRTSVFLFDQYLFGSSRLPKQLFKLYALCNLLFHLEILFKLIIYYKCAAYLFRHSH